MDWSNLSISFDSPRNEISLYAFHCKHIFPQGSDPDLTGVDENLSTLSGGLWITVPGCEQGTYASQSQAVPPYKSMCTQLMGALDHNEEAVVLRKEVAMRKTLALHLLISTLNRTFENLPVEKPP